jgi:hypothetical protein
MRHEEQLVRYVTGQLGAPERARFEEHLAACAECQADLELWGAVASEIVAANAAEAAPASLAERALVQIRRAATPRSFVRRAVQLLRAQAILVQREMWPASAAVMALAAAVALVSGHAEFVYFITPLVAAGSLSVLFGAEHDPAHELVLATPTSSWMLLLARLGIVSAYNLVIALAALAVLLLAFPPGLLGALALGLLAPMAFLSALALLLSLWVGTGQAIAVTYILWLMQLGTYELVNNWMTSPAWAAVIHAYQAFWRSPALLLALSVPLLWMALWSANRPAYRQAR